MQMNARMLGFKVSVIEYRYFPAQNRQPGVLQLASTIQEALKTDLSNSSPFFKSCHSLQFCTKKKMLLFTSFLNITRVQTKCRVTHLLLLCASLLADKNSCVSDGHVF